MNKHVNKIEKLLTELCPNGVEYRLLGEIAELVRGNGLQKKDFIESGVGCIHYGQIYTFYGLFTATTKSFVSHELARTLRKVNTNDIVITNTSENVEDVCTPVVWLGKDEIVTGGHATIIKHGQNAKYLAYYFMTAEFANQKRKLATGTKVIDVSATNLAKVRIPLPPLAVQGEIVRILDNFTTELEAELDAELEARKKQYEYYRDQLLTFDRQT
jgi:type I restriction enzyme S subunit